ncbi:hypothetical protein LUU34_00212700 [Aix galericulata]|nr:hypothetical protein LUU34_00212700 [Aix galericulata]
MAGTPPKPAGPRAPSRALKPRPCPYTAARLPPRRALIGSCGPRGRGSEEGGVSPAARHGGAWRAALCRAGPRPAPRAAPAARPGGPGGEPRFKGGRRDGARRLGQSGAAVLRAARSYTAGPSPAQPREPRRGWPLGAGPSLARRPPARRRAP